MTMSWMRRDPQPVIVSPPAARPHNPGPMLRIADLEAATAPACRCGRAAKYVALVHHVDRCNRIETFSLTPDGARIDLVCNGCVKELADRIGHRSAVRSHPAGGSKTTCIGCGRSLRRLSDWLEIQGLQ